MKLKTLFFLFIMILMASFLSAEEYEHKTARSFTLTAAGTVELANINGEIEISTSSGRTVDIKVVKKSDYKGEIENVEIIFETGQDSLKIYTKYNKKNTRAKVDFTVSIPEKLAKTWFKSVNGEIDCSGQFAELTLKTVNGKIDFHGQFQAGTFKSVNGAIDIVQEPLLSGDLRVSTVNGSIDIELNRKSAFAAEGKTVNGSIDNDFGLQVERHFIGSSFSGTVNGGGHKVKLETVNGRISISKI
ncbi:MAG: DUF4097 family beta strand repeat-containing protein [Chrysiogenia bacterium]